MNIRSTLTVLILLFILLPSNRVNAWSLKTHVFIAQQVLNDVLDDTAVQLAGKKYKVPLHIYYALRDHPDKFRMGSLGPDVFPDFVVGQMTTHPGIPHGWKTDEWLKYILSKAKNREDLAFCYGYVVHASSDIFAHTYVNMYAGDIFSLLDTERTVELRHFTLEKFIERFTPPILDNKGNLVDLKTALSSPRQFLASTLILHDSVYNQHSKDSVSASTYHLRKMYDMHKKVSELLLRIDQFTFDNFLVASKKNRKKDTLATALRKLMTNTSIKLDTISTISTDLLVYTDKLPEDRTKVMITEDKNVIVTDGKEKANVKNVKELNQVQQLRLLEDRFKTQIRNTETEIAESNFWVRRLARLKKSVTAWKESIERSIFLYINASDEAGLKMLRGEDKPMKSYSTWLKCHAWPLVGVPAGIPEGLCNFRNIMQNYLQNFRTQLAAFIPEWVKQYIEKYSEIKKYVQQKLTPVVMDQAGWLAVKVFKQDAQSVQLAYYMWKPGDITREKLDSIYRTDGSTKKLLNYDNISKYVLADMALNGTKYFDPSEFGPVVNSITLSKLALLDPNGLNQLIKDNNDGKSESALYGSPVYPNYKGNYTILFNAVTSIDGNHQWQAYPLPYPRQDYSVKQENSYSYDYNKDRTKGFRLWVDPELRSKVFLKLFNKSSLGSLAEELKLKKYPFLECPDNLFPSTLDRNGRMVEADTTCIK